MIPSEKKLLNLLSNNDVTFFIPPYQRNYEWDESQCKVFWNDILKTAELNSSGKHSEHFFGSVTFFSDGGAFGEPARLILIDGQQRITTTMLFLVAVRDLLNEESQKAFIDNKYLKNKDVVDSTEYKIKLKQVESDWEAYKSIVLSEEIEEKNKDSAVYQNYSYFKNKLIGLQNRGINITDLMANGLDNFSIITIELQPKQNSWENPQEIFESMNSIGKPLSLADLVRNYLLLGLDADTQDHLYKKYWLKIEKTLPKQISFFIRDYMQGMKARPFKQATDTNYKELYSQFKAFFSEIGAEELLKDLAKYAEIYAYISQEHNTGNTLINSELHDLRLINVSTAYSFLMILLNEWKELKLSDKDLADILQAFKIYCYRRRVLGITKGENKRFPALVDSIQELEESVDKKAAMFNILSQQDSNMRLPNDGEMKRTLEVMDFYSFRYCKIFLALIEESLTKSRPELSDSILQIEHIMPRNLNDDWKSDLGENYEQIHQTYVNSIGNLTLIRHNQELGNKEFSFKKDVYVNNSGLQIAKSMITECDKWNEDTIHSRCEWMIDILLQKVLSIPESMKKTNNFQSKEGKHLSFLELQLIGNDINFIADPSISAHVVSDNEVEFEGKRWRLSPLTRELYTRKGTANKSGAYQGSQHWSYDGIKLADII